MTAAGDQHRFSMRLWLAMLTIALCTGSARAADADAQKARLAQIEDFKARAVIEKLEKPGVYAYLTVGPRFFDLSFEDKKAVAGVVFDYVTTEDRRVSTLGLVGPPSGRRIGRFDRYGLKLE